MKQNAFMVKTSQKELLGELFTNIEQTQQKRGALIQTLLKKTMENKDEFKSDVIRAVIQAWLGSISFEEAPDFNRISPNRVESYKRAAKRVLENDAFQGEAHRILEMAKTKIALETKSDLEVAFWRGTINGIKLLTSSLTGFTSSYEKNNQT